MKTKVWDVHLERMAEDLYRSLIKQNLLDPATCTLYSFKVDLACSARVIFDVVTDPRDRSIRPRSR